MSDKLPEKIVRFDLARIKRDTQRLCKCAKPHFEVDIKNRMVRCEDCGAFVDPFYAFEKICDSHSGFDDYLEARRQQAEQIKNWKPHLRVIKELQEHYGSTINTRMVPTCPRCGEHFELEELLREGWQSKSYYDRVREMKEK